MKRIPSLDGLRAVSITLVIVSHLAGTRGFPLPPQSFLNVGNLGVRVFFVISGFLITGLLLAELDRTGGISLRHFYFRRTFRIFPAYYAYLLVIAAGSALAGIDIPGSSLLHAVTYTTNYDLAKVWVLGHAWSLAVEEQFYVMWPLLLLLAGRRRLLPLAAMTIVVPPIARVALLALPNGTIPILQGTVGVSFETVGDAIGMGCLLAILREALWNRPSYRRLLESGWFVAVPAVGLLVASTPGISRMLPPAADYVLAGAQAAVGITILNATIAMCIDWSIRNADSAVGRVLNFPPIATVGVYSYSLYLWQQPFLDRSGTMWWTAFPLNILFVIVLAWASYQFVEKPFLAMRALLETRTRRVTAHRAS